MQRAACCACQFLLVLALVGFPATHASPRMPQSTPTQAALDLVPVNVRVIDRAGKPVTDLKQADFTLLEDGVPQQIRHFALETLAPETPQPGAKPVVRQGILLSPQRHRIFVFALGLGRLEEPLKAVTALLQFVRTRLLPQDQVAVFAYDRALPFTTDHQKVAEMLERFKRSHAAIGFEIEQQLGPTGMAPLYGSRVLSRKLQTKIDEMMFGAGAKGATPVADEVLDANAFELFSLDDFMSGCARTLQDQGTLKALMEYLRNFEGEKHVLFVTEKGPLWPTEENDRALAAAANDGARVGLLDVAVFCLDGASVPVGSHADTITVKLTEDEYKRALKDGLPYLIQFPMIRSTKHVRFIVYDYGSDLIGRTDTTL